MSLNHQQSTTRLQVKVKVAQVYWISPDYGFNSLRRKELILWNGVPWLRYLNNSLGTLTGFLIVGCNGDRTAECCYKLPIGQRFQLLLWVCPISVLIKATMYNFQMPKSEIVLSSINDPL